jgi:hypothetical protein
MQLLIFGIVIFTFFKPLLGSWVFIVISGVLELWIVLANHTKVKVKNNDKYTQKEVEVIERYRLFFQYPFASRVFSPVFSGIQLAVFPLVPWLIIKGFIVQAVIIGFNYFIATQLAVILNPQFFLHDNIDKGKIKRQEDIARFTEDMNAIDSALKKMYTPKE